MTKEIAVDVIPPFTQHTTTTIKFTAVQMIELALKSLLEVGQELDPDSISSTIDKNGLTITSETSIGEAPKKKRAKKASKKVAKKTTKATPQSETKTETTAATEMEEPASVEEKVTEETGNTPFQSTTETDGEPSSNEETIAEVKAAEGVEDTAPFSTETAGIVTSDTGKAPVSTEGNPFDFSKVG